MALPNVNECTHAKHEQALKILALVSLCRWSVFVGMSLALPVFLSVYLSLFFSVFVTVFWHGRDGVSVRGHVYAHIACPCS